MEIIVKAAVISIPAALIAQALRKDSPVMAVCVLIAAAVVTVYMAAEPIGGVAEAMSELASTAGLGGEALSAVLKTLGISVIARISADMLKDSGMQAAASAVELAGSAAGLFVTLPLLRTVLDMVKGLL